MRVGWSVPEVATALGVSQKHIWRLIDRGEIEKFYVGRLVRIPDAELKRISTPK